MSAVDDFKCKFDEEGRFRESDGTLNVVFATKGGGRFPGKLHFKGGLCVRAEMEGGGDWGLPDNSPIHDIRFLLDFDDGEVVWGRDRPWSSLSDRRGEEPSGQTGFSNQP